MTLYGRPLCWKVYEGLGLMDNWAKNRESYRHPGRVHVRHYHDNSIMHTGESGERALGEKK